MNKKIIFLVILNILGFSIIAYLHGYRFNRTTIYNEDKVALESEAYEVLYKDRKYAVVRYDNLYKIYAFERYGPLIRDSNGYINHNNMFEFLYEPSYEPVISSLSIFTDKDMEQLKYTYSNDEKLFLVSTSYHDLEFKMYDLINDKTKKIEYDKINIDNNLYVFKVYDIELDHGFVLRPFVGDEPIESKMNLETEKHYDIQFEDKLIKEASFVDLLKQISYKSLNDDFINPDKTTERLRYHTQLKDQLTGEIHDYQSIFFEYENQMYWTDNIERLNSVYLINNRQFSDAFEKLKLNLKQ